MDGASERKKRRRRGDACAPSNGGTSRNEMHGNIQGYERPKEARKRKREREREEAEREDRGREKK